MNIKGIGKEFEEAMQKVAAAMAEFGKMYHYMRDILDFPQGYAPIEYARLTVGRTPQRITSRSGSGYILCGHAASWGMVWKKGRWVRRRV